MIPRDRFDKAIKKYDMPEKLEGQLYDSVSEMVKDRVIDDDYLEWAIQTTVDAYKGLVKAIRTKEEFAEVLREFGLGEKMIEEFWNSKPPHIKEFSRHALEDTVKQFLEDLKKMESKI